MPPIMDEGHLDRHAHRPAQRKLPRLHGLEGDLGRQSQGKPHLCDDAAAMLLGSVRRRFRQSITMSSCTIIAIRILGTLGRCSRGEEHRGCTLHSASVESRDVTSFSEGKDHKRVLLLQTELLKPAADFAAGASIARAADVLRSGGLVAFPTETVYGLGAVATDIQAVARIFAAKGRPETNPVIVHVADIAAARHLVLDWPRSAQLLAERFWPGPLTLVLPRRDGLSDLVTAGGSTVGVRVPAHPIALALVRATQLPIAAPSANRSQRLSPTTAEHVMKQLSGRIELVLDGGPTPGGLESTVLDLSDDQPCLLRPGLVPLEVLEVTLGQRVLFGQCRRADEVARSPGMHERHYAPLVPVTLCRADCRNVVEQKCDVERLVGYLAFGSTPGCVRANLRTIEMPIEPENYSARLYAALHDMEEAGVTSIVVEMPPQRPEWLAVEDRLRRAAVSDLPRGRDAPDRVA